MNKNVGFIAVGQAGGNIGDLLEKKGYEVFYINTSPKDLQTLETAKYKFVLTNGEGCSNDRERAKRHVVSDFVSIKENIDKKLGSKDLYVVIFSSGGGTGSGASPMLIDLLQHETKIPICAVTIIPSDQEGLRKQMNSYDCFSELGNINGLGATFIIDNNKGDIIELNHRFVDLFDQLLQLPEHIHHKGIIDESEVKELLHTKGAAFLGQRVIKDKDSVDITEIIEQSIFAPVESDKVIKYIALSTSAAVNVDQLIEKYGRPLDVFNGRNKERTLLIMAGLSYPYAVFDKMLKTVEDNKDSVLKNIEINRTVKMTSGINFLKLSEISNEQKLQPAQHATTNDILSKYVKV